MEQLEEDEKLLQAVKLKLPELKKKLVDTNGDWTGVDLIYRFYHHSFKVFWLQEETELIVTLLKSLAPDKTLNKDFLEIFQEGTGKKFDLTMNRDWTKHSRPIVEAYFHARFFLEMAVQSGEEMESADCLLPSNWAAFLYLFNMR